MKDLFIYYNPNPMYTNQKHWDRCDCVLRALCVAEDCLWMEAFEMTIKAALKVFDVQTGKRTAVQLWKDLHYEKISYKKGCRRETVREFAKNHPKGTYIMNLSGHVCCCQNGHYYDTWDCGDRTLYNYYIKKENQ